MTAKKNEWEGDISRAQLSVETEIITVDFQKSDAIVGQTLDGRFLIEKDLTEDGADAGGIGLVYLARDMKLMGRKTVVKILKKSLVKDEDVARKFLHEKEALIRLDHPNIVSILDSGTLLDGNPFMVMEFIEGYSLRRVLQLNKKLPFDFVAHITEAITDALSTAHSKKILHRDIKPANIMLTPREEGFDRVRLIDFGIARVEDSQLAAATATQRSIGTLLYIAPEQLWGKLEQTPAVDIYAFAIVVYEMLTGELPFKPESIVEMFELQKQGVRTLPGDLRRDLPAEAEKILLAALEFEAGKRPQNARAFGRALANALRAKANYKTNKDSQMPEPAKTAAADFKAGEIITPAPTEPAIDIRESNFPNVNLPEPPKKKSNKKLVFGLLCLLVLTAVSIPIGLVIWQSANQSGSANKSDTNTNSAPLADAASHELVYFLTVQKMRDGNPFEEPFKSSGREIFENGYKFKINFKSDAAGFIYFFNEDKDAQGDIVYNILYPTLKTNKGSAEIKAKQLIETNQNTFGGARGTEVVWLIWTTTKQDDLEAARQSAFDGQGKLTDEASVKKLKDFLVRYKDKITEASKDTASQQTVVRGKGDALAYRIELEHR
ncbi:MAG TPA: serine/threonine-protein kinase [Pyrinomonadaceae bacterium]|jgi:serine/threonine-protein kinase